LPIHADVIALPGASPRLLGAYLESLSGDPAADSRPDFLALAVAPGEVYPVTDPELDGLVAASAADVVSACQLTGRAGETALIPATVAGHPVSVLLIGVGDRSPRSLRRAGAELGRRIADGATAVTSIVAGGDEDDVRAFAEGVALGGYRFDLKSGQPAEPGPPGLAQLLVGVGGDWSAALHRASVTAAAVGLARDLANQPSAVKSPQWLADRALEATAAQGVTGRIWSTDELTRAGFGGILAVGSGSARPPRLIELSYHPDGAQGHTVLVGKGITFDSGGLSLKPNDAMMGMKNDMAGGAAVIAVLSALARLGVRRRVTGLVAAAENLPSGSAYRPGDVLTQYGGKTVEVLNTDAEGRLVLADAMAYAVAALEPDAMIDIATLTGAARVALGTTHAALYATDDALATALTAAGEASGDRVWRMPLADGYATALASDVADICHVARDGSPGSITAALFLREFAGEQPWAHLDIAGTGRSAENSGELAKGATGFGVRLLLDLLAS
jgi:leucyl aminopeptidase